jgi:hypothetical protein
LEGLFFKAENLYFALLIQKDGGIGPDDVLATVCQLYQFAKLGANFHASQLNPALAKDKEFIRLPYFFPAPPNGLANW